MNDTSPMRDITEDTKRRLRQLPAVDALLEDARMQEILGEIPRDLAVYCLRRCLEEARADILGGSVPDVEGILGESVRMIRRLSSPTIQRAVNATGIVIHTNLGRSVLSDNALEAVISIASHYSTLEYDTERQSRGSRHQHLEPLLCYLTGAEAALAVNNNAAAVLLVLSEFAKGRQALVSRGELIEIGGSFRIPDIMASSGAEMVEVGTTNKTRAADYAAGITDETGIILKVHPSNYRVIGFTEDASIEELRRLADDANRDRSNGSGSSSEVIVYEDQGSGSFIDLGPWGLGSEPTVQESLKKGADIVSFSGDKLLGGAQAGIIVGRKPLIDRLKGNPLVRALRLDKMSIAALEATLLDYALPGRAVSSVPTLRMLTLPADALLRNAESLAHTLREHFDEAQASFEVVETTGQSGGGSLPECEFPSFAVAVGFNSGNAQSCERWLVSQRRIPIVGRISRERLLLDVRTLLPGDEEEIIDGLAEWFSLQRRNG